MNTGAMKENLRIKYIDYMRGIGALLVIIGHADPKSVLGCFIYSFHMPLFFFIAGYVYKHKDAINMITSKVRYLLVPYFVSRLIINPLTQGLSIVDSKYIIDVLFYGSDNWFLYALFWTIMSFWIMDEIVTCLKRRINLYVLNYWFIPVLIICVVIRKLGVLDVHVFAFCRMTYEIVYFIIGYFLKNYSLAKIKDILSGNVAIIVEAVLLILFNYLNPYKQWYYFPKTEFIQYITALIGIGLVFNLCIRIKESGIISKFTSYMGKYSLQYYIFPNIPVSSCFGSGMIYIIWQFLCHTLYIYIAKKSKFLSFLYGIRYTENN